MQIKILYQDPHLLVIDKPFGIVVNRADTVKEDTVQDWVEAELKINPPANALRKQMRAGDLRLKNKDN